jgi:hypothetical protein
MKRKACVLGCLAVLLVCATSAGADAPRAYLVRDDFGSEPLYDCYLSYYYYIPCPTYSWFWSFSSDQQAYIIGAWFEVGDPSMGGGATCDPSGCFSLERFRFIEFSGYANYPRYPNWYAVQYDIYCADESGCPVGPSLWHNEDIRSTGGWTYVDFDPPLSLCACSTQPGEAVGARVLITVRQLRHQGGVLEWGIDNLCTPTTKGCIMHDLGCLPALYPRPTTGYYETMHSGYYGIDAFEYCPPQWFEEPQNSEVGEPYGYSELGFRIYVGCSGPSDVEPMSWGKIKSLYR